MQNTQNKKLIYTVCLFCFFVVSCTKHQEIFIPLFKPSAVEVGHLYEYHGSYNKHKFIFEDDRLYFYLASDDTVETLSIKATDPHIRGILTISRSVLDFQHSMIKEKNVECFLTPYFKIGKNSGTDVKSSIQRNFQTMDFHYNGYMILGNEPETFRTPKHEEMTTKFTLENRTLFRFDDNIPELFFMLAPFIPIDRTVFFPVSQAGYETVAECHYEKAEVNA